MAQKSTNTEHSGAKGSRASDGYWGRRADAKHDSSRARRRNDKRAVKEQHG